MGESRSGGVFHHPLDEKCQHADLHMGFDTHRPPRVPRAQGELPALEREEAALDD
jgi:hypothetical protein